MEHRHIFTANARLAFADEANPRRLTGYAIVWNEPSTDRGGFKVKLLPGSARFATPTMALYNHQKGNLLGTTNNDTLRLTPDNIGVRFELDVANTTIGNDTLTLVKDKYVQGMSFGMVADPKGRTVYQGGQRMLEVSDFLADEISVVYDPAFLTASVRPAGAGPTFSQRTRQALQLQRLRFSQLQLAGDVAGVLPR